MCGPRRTMAWTYLEMGSSDFLAQERCLQRVVLITLWIRVLAPPYLNTGA